jgi:proteasome lid subunit RPN8/RPN11
MPPAVPPEFLEQIKRQAERDYPRETCGIMTGPIADKRLLTKVYPCRNVQDEYHALDPSSFPRTAQTAYFIDPQELLRIQRESREKACELRVIYHSHVNTGAYFSEEDQRIALSEGKPSYPGVSYLVISVREGKAGEAFLFNWEEKSRNFVKTELK